MTQRHRLVGLAAVLMLMLGIPAAEAAMKTERIDYTIGETAFEGVLVWDETVTDPRPAILFAPNWMGINEATLEKAKRVAGDRYVVFVADMYGVDTRPANRQEASSAAGAVRGDLDMQRARVNKAFDVMVEAGGKHGLIDAERTAAIGFCFGGGNVLELARSGRDTKAVVSFHGSLLTDRPEDARNITASVLVLHGAADPSVPEADRSALEKELTEAGVKDWQIVAYGNAVHSFTDPLANDPETAQYDEQTAERAFAAMNALFDEVF
ncbi:MAG: dienelactone hydrolase family protein [Sphingomonadales bacterium]